MTKHRLTISVRALVEQVLRCGDLELNYFRTVRLVDAIRAHQAVQRSRPADYQSEVSVSHDIEIDPYVLSVSGRLDGLFTEPGREPVIEEIKTTTKTLASVTQTENPLHWGQVKVYAYLYAAAHHVATVGAQLTYYQIETGETQIIRKRFHCDELKTFFGSLVSQYMAWAETIVEWRGIRDESIVQLGFPFADYRTGQRRMAKAVYRAIQHQRQLIIQAATGIGKTMAVIFPAVKGLGLGLTSKIFYLTARTTARTMPQNAFESLARGGLRLKTLTITAKDAICFQPERECNAEACPYAKGYYDRINAAVTDIFNIDAFTQEAIEHYARSHVVCPFEFSLELSMWADAVICDYNYAFDPRVYLRRFFDIENTDYTVLIDEAHNLVDRSRMMFSAELWKQAFLDVRRPLKDQQPAIHRTLTQINSWMLKCCKRPEAEQDTWAEKDAPEGLPLLLFRFLRAAEKWLVQNRDAPFRKPLLEIYFACGAFLRTAEHFDRCYATVYTKADKDFQVKLFCIDPSPQLKQTLQRCKSVVFFSATMTPSDYFINMFGCESGADTLSIPSPFAPENMGVYVLNRISTYYKDRSRTAPVVARAVESLVSAKNGNYLVFCPSYRYMRQIYQEFVNRLPRLETIIQVPGMSPGDRDAFLARFAEDNPNWLIGFAVMGGIFGEGIDLVGDRLCGAAIIGVGLPAVSTERELIRTYFANTRNSGFEFAYVFPGINRVLQAAGRVIRSGNDRGVVMLVDKRFGAFPYHRLLPREWRPVKLTSPAGLDTHIKQFWGLSHDVQLKPEVTGGSNRESL